MSKLTEAQRKYLRGLSHRLQPLARVGNAGLSDAFVAEVDHTLSHHELVKVRVPAGGDRAGRDAAITGLAERLGAVLVTRIGHVALLYRRNPETPRIQLPAP
jgi:RNA-binding protein